MYLNHHKFITNVRRVVSGDWGGDFFCAEINSEIVVESIPLPSTDKDFMDFGK